MALNDGQPMGCSDGGTPETYNDEMLSRAVDLIHAVKAHAKNIVTEETVHCSCRSGCNHIELALAETEREMINNCIPECMRFEITWSKWTYRSKR